MPVWGFDTIEFQGKDPATWTDEDRAAASKGHVLTDPLEGLPLVDDRRWAFGMAAVPERHATVHRLIGPFSNDPDRYNVNVAIEPRGQSPGERSVVLDLPSLDHAIAYCNDRGWTIIRLVAMLLTAHSLADHAETRPDE